MSTVSEGGGEGRKGKRGKGERRKKQGTNRLLRVDRIDAVADVVARLGVLRKERMCKQMSLSSTCHAS
jgi:hypothetical protein